MDIKIKILACVAPFGIAAAVGFTLLQPAVTEYQDKASNVEKKQQEKTELEGKLANRGKIQKEKKDLEDAIAALRGSVPKKPELDILNIDLEKMALDSGMDLVAIKQPGKDELKKAGIEDETSGSGSNIAKNKEALANKVKAAAAPAAAAASAAGAAVGSAAGAAGKAGKGKGAKEPSVAPDGGLLKNTLQVKLIGSYKNLMSFTQKLERYQRVVAISDMHVTMPKGEQNAVAATAKAATLPDESDLKEQDMPGDPNRLNVSMMLTTYYLP
jgi:Tfp pilus assembly protein PilO